MKPTHILARLAFALLPLQTAARALGGKPSDFILPEKRAPLQDIVTWDEHSLFVHGERIIFWGGEFHPFRLPVPSLWLDIFQKIKAMGYNGASFYSAWVLHEPKPGHFQAEGVFDWEPYFEAAKKAGVYLVARPGPYINAEVSGGGFPGWLQRISGNLRTPDEDFQQASKHYIESITPIIAKAQITNGGPVILFQPENEYSAGLNNVTFPDADYMNNLMKQFRDLGIVVPLINNVAWPSGINAPGTEAPVDIYGHDSYPLGMNCTDPTFWTDDALPTDWRKTHLEQSPSTPYMLVEYQGGAYQPWGGDGFEKCSEFINHEFERVFYKNNVAAGATIFNVYMTFGGTNWGNLGHAGGYTSYDYGAAITEERLVSREKYSEAKLIANFVHASPALASAVPGYNTTGIYTNTSLITVTPVLGEKTKFYVTRHTRYNTFDSTTYKLRLQTSVGNITIPQLGGSLSMNGRDTKIHVTDYDVGGFNLLYSTAEIFTWKQYGMRRVLVVHGGPNEVHELAVSKTSEATSVEGSGVKFSNRNGHTILNWQSAPSRRVVRIGKDLYIVILDRNSAYNYWTVSTLSGESYTHDATPSSDLIVSAGYLIRSASISESKIHLIGDINATTTIEIVGGAHENIVGLTFNGEDLHATHDRNGFLKGTVAFSAPEIRAPDVKSLSWKYIDALPELQSSYDDSAWTDADHTETNNTYWPLTTPTVLWGAEYGYNTGSLILRGHFVATGTEDVIHLNVSGGSAFAFSAWINQTFIGSWSGNSEAAIANETLSAPTLTRGDDYVLTVLMDHMGHNGNWFVGFNEQKTPRGIIGYDFPGHTISSSNSTRTNDGIRWKISGNLGGEDYHGGVRGPLNEGALYPERNGFHLPAAPTSSWDDSAGPTTALSKPGVAFYTTSFKLDLPTGWDIPLSFIFHGDAFNGKGKGWRAQLWVNGYQFGKFLNGVGPQRRFPVPEGIFDYSGDNQISVSIWALEAGGATPEGFELVVGTPVKTGYGEVAMAPMSSWEERQGAY
ncbi:glycoside hydrolase family 35 protein [Dothidotthia symphoricarpi CBS 119687]|uniref:Beta-galactosidase n=1 Tax=Dothidotthia symphoricarpi CBS 119687 TaxID=1392245 RepID=A0A6A6AC10_9PLEO|nr:glycoside hydrolase family 35 protein [Dothidotthia symphoricarpi CBS 119687]KAF2128763.1 glycoside hydrolase family 35 protein [Dothidotthia symphoricarpi CBS 119687]